MTKFREITKYSFGLMAVNEEKLIPASIQKVAPAAAMYAKRSGMKFKCRTVTSNSGDKCTNVTRVK